MTTSTTDTTTKRSKLPFILIVLILIVGAAFGGVAYAEKKMTDSAYNFVESLPDGMNAKIESADYSLLTQTLTVGGYSMQTPNGETFTVGEVTLKGISHQAFMPTAGDYPLVAEEIYISDGQMEVIKDDVRLYIDIGSYTIKNWRQNLFLLSEASRKGYDSEEFLSRLFTIKLDENFFTDFNIIAESLDPEEKDAKFSLTFGEFSLVPTPESTPEAIIADFASKNFEFFLHDENNVGGIVVVDYKESSSKNMSLLSAEQLSLLFKTLAGKNKVAFEDFLLSLSTPTGDDSLLSENFMQGLRVLFDEYTVLTLDEVKSTARLSPFLFEYDINRLVLTKHLLFLIEQALGDYLPLDELIINTSIKSESHDEMKSFTNRFNFELVSLFNAKLNFGLEFPESLQDMTFQETEVGFLPSEQYIEILEDALLKNFSFTYSDHGLIPTVFYAVEQQGIPLLLSQGLASGQLQSLSKRYPLLSSSFNNLDKMIHEPGKLELTLSDCEIKDLFGAALSPNALVEVFGFTSTYTSGGKTTKTLIQELFSKGGNK